VVNNKTELKKGTKIMKSDVLIIKKWLESQGFRSEGLTQETMEAMRRNANTLRLLYSLSVPELGEKMFPGKYGGRGSLETVAGNILRHGSLEELTSVPTALGFNSKVLLIGDLQKKVTEYLNGLCDNLTAQESVLKNLPHCQKCGRITTVSGKFCPFCGQEYS